MSRRPLSDDERVLWRTVTQSIAPLRGRKAEDTEVAGAKPKPLRSPDEAKRNPGPPVPHSAAIHAGYSVPPALAPIDRRTKQKLARGTTSIDGRIDLHGLTQADAHAALARFLRQAQSRDAKLVLVITGKGGGTGDGRGVLRRAVPLWLEGVEFRSLVIGYDLAGVGHGGEGALYVRVRRGR
ncbi:MAG: Smr/MutS family protein [Alphaproteobacteria bacterium]|nr:Smr/MutS family protein [Alphaproteobacteria bacterium]